MLTTFAGSCKATLKSAIETTTINTNLHVRDTYYTIDFFVYYVEVSLLLIKQYSVLLSDYFIVY